ncbi:hypothetical protein W02_41180 [Nitrospira sp. KM1]|uniref:DUF1428 domain-containing protein n=1 Tax=Nitrospira sp. KM1 TaxID=1936990 RepID=UPI0013A771F3|nr:DUF1428 domain-containing protein [Nitrospira sp. KM1]BCA56978.1 hypothetical protein W02_41180 [Nitrospira sp. KM1]
MRYVDGYVLPVPKRNLPLYKRIARVAAKVWREHGALDYKECVGDDLKKTPYTMPFPAIMKLKAGETVVFAYILFKSRAHRNRVNTLVMKDPRLAASMKDMPMPFDTKRMVYGGFKVFVDF